MNTSTTADAAERLRHEARRAAREVLGRVTCDTLSLTREADLLAVSDVPADLWPDKDTADIAHAIRSLNSDCRPVDVLTTYEEVQRLGLAVKASTVAELSEFIRDTLVADIPARVNVMREWATWKRRQSAADVLMDPSADGQECRAVLADLEMEPARDTLPQVDHAEALRLDPPRVAPVVLEGVLRRGHKMLLAGPSKSGKSFALIRLALAVTGGREWFGHRCTPGRVFFANLEIDRASFWRRVSTVREHVEADYFSLNIWNLRGVPITLEQFADRVIQHARGCSLIVIDPVYRLLGNADENAAGDITALLNQFERIAEQTGAALVFSHHYAKGMAGGKDVLDRASGSGAFARHPDALVMLTPLEAEDVPYAFRVEYRLREFADPAPYAVVFEYPLHVAAPLLDAHRLRGEPGRPTSITHPMLKTVLTNLQSEGVTASLKVVSDRLNVSSRTVRRLVENNPLYVIDNGVLTVQNVHE